MLNQKQEQAVQIIDGPVMVIAGAGSGKTRVLTERLIFLIGLGINPSNILAVTFTNKAAFEMKERIGEKGGNSWVSTFHSLCARLLRAHMHEFKGYNNSFVIIDDDDAKGIIRNVIKELNFDPDLYPAKKYYELISKEKNGEIIILKDQDLKDYEKIKSAYNDYLRNENLLDFDDLLLFTLRLFKEFPNILDYYQERFKYIMIDEFQDTNKVQYDLIEILASKYQNIFIVGDEDQSIYSFRGANIGNIQAFEKKFPNLQKVILDINYRSTQNILNVANSLIHNNPNRNEKNLTSNNDKGNMVVYERLESSYEEITYLISQIDRLKKMGYEYKDMGLFYRTNALSRTYEEAFRKMQIPYKIFGGTPFYGRKEIKDIVAYLRLILNQDHLWSFKRIINTPKRGIGEATINKLVLYCSDNGYQIMEGINFFNNKKLLEFKEVFDQIINQVNQAKTLPEFVNIILDLSGYKLMLVNENQEGLDRLENINEFKSTLAEADEYFEGTLFEKLNYLLEELSLKTDIEDTNITNAISMMNFHQAKGLEFRAVFMVAMEQGIFPSLKSLINKKDLEEERRVAYVGITRAKEQLYMTSAKVRRLYGNIEIREQSMFINELDFAYINSKNKKEISEEVNDIITHINNSEVTYKTGDKINHQYFGDGVVVNADEEYLEVAFKAPYGVKKLLAKHPAIKKKE